MIRGSIKHSGHMVGVEFKDGKTARAVWVRREILERLHDLLTPSVMGCWLWTGAMHRDGRALLTVDGELLNVKRLLYDLKHGPLPQRKVLGACDWSDNCVNPDHVAVRDAGPVRGTMGPFERDRFDVCPRGHALTPDNAYVYQGKKLCRTCRALAEKNYRARSVGRRTPSGRGRRPSPL